MSGKLCVTSIFVSVMMYGWPLNISPPLAATAFVASVYLSAQVILCPASRSTTFTGRLFHPYFFTEVSVPFPSTTSYLPGSVLEGMTVIGARLEISPCADAAMRFAPLSPPCWFSASDFVLTRLAIDTTVAPSIKK